MIDFNCREKTWGQCYDDPAPVRSTQRCNTGRDDLDMNGNSNRSLANELSTASPTEVVPQPRVIPSLPVKGTRYRFDVERFNVIRKRFIFITGIIRNKTPRPVECLEDPEVRKRKWTLPLGQVQLLSCYDSRAHILYVTIIRARKLQTRRPNGDARPDPLVRCVLLPGRKAENERRTRYLSLTSDPEWHQTMV